LADPTQTTARLYEVWEGVKDTNDKIDGSQRRHFPISGSTRYGQTAGRPADAAGAAHPPRPGAYDEVAPE